jgi:glycosyltransferase involved in cell wall biosynthesis
MMKIAMCVECPIAQHGGVEVLVRALIQDLSDHLSIYLVSEDSETTLEASGLRPHLTGAFSWKPAVRSASQIQELAAWAKEQQIDLFHFHHGGTYSWNSRSWRRCPITAMARHGFRCVSTNHGAFGFWLYVGAQRSLAYRLAALIPCWPAKLRQVASVEWEATVSHHDLRAVRRWFFPLQSKFRQIYHSILSESVLPDLPKKSIVLCLGTVGARKGQPYLADAFGRIAHKYPDWKLVIAGRHADDGTPRALQSAITRHGLDAQVEILTDVPDSLARNLLAEAAIFAMPSLAEGLGLSLQEALYARAACVGSRVGGITDLILDDTTGLLVPPADPEALAAALDRLMGDPILRERLGDEGKKHVVRQGMTRAAMSRNHAALYHRKEGD